MVDNWWSNFHVLLTGILFVQINVKVFLHVLTELGEELTTEHVAFALYLNLLLLLDEFKTGVLIAPSLKLEKVDLNLTVWVVVNDLRVGLAIH